MDLNRVSNHAIAWKPLSILLNVSVEFDYMIQSSQERNKEFMTVDGSSIYTVHNGS